MGLVSNIAKTVDQAVLVQSLQKIVSPALFGGAAAITAIDTMRAKPEERVDRFVRDASLLGITALSAWGGFKLLGENDMHNVRLGVHMVRDAMARAGKPVTNELDQLLNKADGNALRNMLNPDEIGRLRDALPKDVPGILDIEEALAHYSEKAGGVVTDAIKPFLDAEALKEGEWAIKHSISADEFKGLVGELKSKIELPFASLKDEAEGLFDRIVPPPSNMTFQELREGIVDLSLLGLFPVLGGIVGGAVGNILTKKPWLEDLRNQSKEGAFQYLANIVLCNVGAMGALGGLGVLDKFKPGIANSRTARLVGLTAGVISVGVVGGSAIANFIGKNFLNPLFDHGPGYMMKNLREHVKEKGIVHGMLNDLYAERHPEAADVALHVDDFATIGYLSGLRWVAPLLPMLYSFSGFRAGIGYRNGELEEKGPLSDVKPVQDVLETTDNRPLIMPKLHGVNTATAPLTSPASMPQMLALSTATPAPKAASPAYLPQTLGIQQAPVPQAQLATGGNPFQMVMTTPPLPQRLVQSA